jgi:diguanylate cyclase (GGDEF)-like protein
MRAFHGSIRFRLFTGFAILAVVLASLAGYVGRFVERQQAGLEQLREAQAAFFDLNRVAGDFNAFQAASLSSLRTRETVAAARLAFEQSLALYARRSAATAAEMKAQADLFAQRLALQQAAAPTDPELARMTSDTRAAVIALGAALRRGFDELDARYKAVIAAEFERQQSGRRGFYALVAGTLAALLLYAAFLLHTILRPLGATLAGIRALRSGSSLPALPSRGEFGEIAEVLDELRDATQVIRDHAYYDTATGLVSRPRFEQWIGEGLQHAPAQSLVVVLIELQQMREIASAWGPGLAARALRIAAERLQRGVPGEQAPARYGDVRFGCLLQGLTEDVVQARVRSLLELLRAPMSVDGLTLSLQACAGLASAPRDGADVPALLAAAEAALLGADARGAGAIASYDVHLGEGFRRDFGLLQDLERGLGQDEFVPWFEPIVDCARGCVIAAEALVRWQHPVRGLLPPAEFLPGAERGGQIAMIDAQCFGKAIAQLGRWQRAGSTLRQGLNLSPRHLSAETVTRIEEALAAGDVQASALVFELTETAVIAQNVETDGVIRDLHGLGAKICLDDFGTGFSSLSYVRRLPIERLKIDRSFVAEIGRSGAAERIIEATLSLARSIGIVAVAEGVETVEQMRWLLQRDCVRQQGWLFGRAQPAAGFEAWLGGAEALLADLLQPRPLVQVGA